MGLVWGWFGVGLNRDRFWPNRTEPRMARHQNGRTEIYRDFLGTKMAEPRFCRERKMPCRTEPNRDCRDLLPGDGGVHPIKNSIFNPKSTIKVDIFLLDHAGHPNPVFVPRMILAEPNRTENCSAQKWPNRDFAENGMGMPNRTEPNRTEISVRFGSACQCHSRQNLGSAILAPRKSRFGSVRPKSFSVQ